MEATDKLMLPAWSRGQEREADLLGLDLLVESKHSPPAMISMLEKLQAWEKATTESEAGFQERIQRALQREALGLAYQKLVSTFGGAPRWTPHKIRLLRKVGRVAEASTLVLTCSVSTPDWKRPCQEANQTPVGRAQR